MSVLTDHPINGLINNVLALAEDERLPKLQAALTSDLRAGLGRIFNFGRLVRDLLEKSGPEEVSLGGLNALNSNLQQSYSELSAFVSSGNQANLGNALANLDNAAAVFTWTFYDRPVKGAKPQFESVESVRRAAEKAITSIEARAAGFSTSITATTSQLQAQDQRIAELTATMEQVRSTSSAAVASIQQQFSENLSAYRSEIDGLKTTFRATQQEFSDEVTHDAETLIKELETQRDKAAQIVQIVGNIGVTGNYKLLADKENLAADRWRQITLGFFVIGILLVSAVLLHHLFGSETSGLDSLIVRFALAAVVTVPALYAAGESSRHRRTAEAARRTELQLASLNPFLATLPEDKRNEIIESLAPSYFTSSAPQPVEAPAQAEGLDLTKVLGEIANIITRAKS